MKKLINSVDNIVTEMLDGMACAYPEYIKRLEGLDVVVRANGSKGKVALVSGGGQGNAGCCCCGCCFHIAHP